MKHSLAPLAATLLAAPLLSGCVQPTYAPMGPIDLQNYGAYPLPYSPDPAYNTDRSALPPPVPIPLPDPEPTPLAQPLPPPADSAPSPADTSGAIPLQDMPAPLPETSSVTAAPSASAAPAPAPDPAPSAVGTPSSGPGSNVPLEGFRPMRGQTRPAP